MTDARRATGQIGEQAAYDYLIEHGYDVVSRNWRCRSGELDLIAARTGVLHIVEVRTRRAGGRFGTAAESVDGRKQSKLRAVAQVYLKMTGWNGDAIRFDVIAVTMDKGGTIIEIKHYEGAF